MWFTGLQLLHSDGGVEAVFEPQVPPCRTGYKRVRLCSEGEAERREAREGDDVGGLYGLNTLMVLAA